MQLRRSTV